MDESADREAVVEPETLKRAVSTILLACGLSQLDAEIVTQVLVGTDLRGVRTHGVALLPWYVEGLTTGLIDPNGVPEIVHEIGAIAVVDANGAMGHLAAVFATNLAIERAAKFGLASVAVRGSNHCGAVGHYARLASANGKIALVFATTVPVMAPVGGEEVLLGNNPIAIALPEGEQGDVVFDAAFSVVSRGRVAGYARMRKEIPYDWALNQDGEPTTDPEAALRGSLQPLAGYKGSGLAIMVGLLASVLGGAGFGEELGSLADGPRPAADGILVLVIDPSFFAEEGTVARRVEVAAERLRKSRPIDEGEPVIVPGDRATSAERQHTLGIPLDSKTISALSDVCSKLGLRSTELGLPTVPL